MEPHVQEQLRHQNRSQHEHQRMRPEGDLSPQVGDERPVVGRDSRSPKGADRQSRTEHRNHAGNMHDLFSDDENKIGERDRQRRFGQPIVPGPGDELQQRPPRQQPESRAAEEGDQKLLLANEEVRLAPGDDHAEQHREHDDRRCVIQESFALDESGEPRRRAHIAEHRDDGRRVGGRDDRAQQQAHHERQAGDRPEGETDHCGADDGRDNRQHQNRGGVLKHPPHIGGDRALEHQERQKDVNEGLGADREVGEQRGDVVEAVGDRRVKQDAGHRPDRHPDDGEEHHRRELQAHRHRLGDGDDHEQGREYGQKQDDIDHRGLCPTRSPPRGATRIRAVGRVKPISLKAGFSARRGRDRRPRKRRTKACAPCRRSVRAGSASDGRAAETGPGRRA